jgi:Fe2+ transport system protein FeoA
VLRPRPRDGLSATAVGVTVRLTDVDLPVAERLRLAEFGLRPGAVVTVLARTSGDGRLIGVGHSRIALDRHTAARMTVDGTPCG